MTIVNRKTPPDVLREGGDYITALQQEADVGRKELKEAGRRRAAMRRQASSTKVNHGNPTILEYLL